MTKCVEGIQGMQRNNREMRIKQIYMWCPYSKKYLRNTEKYQEIQKNTEKHREITEREE